MGNAVPFLRRVQMTGYKSIASCDVTFTRLLVLLGPNGAGKSNFLDALQFVAQVLGPSTPADVVAARGGLDEVLRRAPQPTDQFSIHLEFTVDGADGPQPAEYGFTIGRDSTGRRPLVIKEEHCVISPGTEQEAGFRVVAGMIVNEGGIERDQLYLPLAAARSEFSEVHRSLRSMLFHHLDTDQMRQIEPDRRGTQLGYSGERLGSVLGTLAERHPVFKQRIDDYLRAIVPTVAGIDQQILGDYSTVELRTPETARPFGPKLISEGTLHAAGLLAALFQPVVLEGKASLVAIEEPETALHPAATGALFDALTEASERVQVIVTTQSADLLDHDDFDPSWVRIATMKDGITVIGEIDPMVRGVLDDKLATLGELMRSRQLRPKGSE
ncbi:AAA family ATPase [Nonomuraea sp. NPDC052129]|uniref:AAA family ATPase n=1 Tax=Nonomuraea sp. NPDC052129 TaxID=3154651 RepID=UPI00343690C6